MKSSAAAGWCCGPRASATGRSWATGPTWPTERTCPTTCLIGVQTRTPENDQLRSGQTWMGSPPLLLPARERIEGFPESLTFRPTWVRRFGRAAVESLRIVLPLAFVIASGYLIVQVVMPIAEDERVVVRWSTPWPWPACCTASVRSCWWWRLKWILVGRYRPRAAPMWTPFVWLSEAVTNVYESLAVPNLLEHLRGTPLLPWALRLFGARIGRGVYLDTTDLTEFDCVRIGDEAELNGWCGPQTHLFEDRVMKIGCVEIGARASIGESSTVLYDTRGRRSRRARAADARGQGRTSAPRHPLGRLAGGGGGVSPFAAIHVFFLLELP